MEQSSARVATSTTLSGTRTLLHWSSPKVAEKVLLEGAPIRATVENWPDRIDFMCRVKIPRSSTLWGSDGKQLPNMLRYYVSKGGRR